MKLEGQLTCLTELWLENLEVRCNWEKEG